MTQQATHFHLLALVLFLFQLVGNTNAFVSHFKITLKHVATDCSTLKVFGTTKDTTDRISRRDVFQKSMLIGAGLSFLRPAPAHATKDRNEALCATGFFTNIAQYKCTEIGDISEDGKIKPISSSEEQSMDSLLGKLGVDSSISDGGDEDGEAKKASRMPKSKSQE